jgi:hypothetical protein
MAQVHFHSMSFDFAVVKIHYNTLNFQGFVLQPESQEPNNKKDEFVLVAYPQINNQFEPEIQLVKEAEYEPINSKKVVLGNIYFGGTKLKKFIDSDLITKIDHLLFTPKKYPEPNGKHIGYNVKAIPERFVAESLVEEELNPSPPATPGFS